MGIGYDNDSFQKTFRDYFPLFGKIDAGAAAGTVSACSPISFPVSVKVVGFGIQSCASDVICSTGLVLEFRNANSGAKLGARTFASEAVLGTRLSSSDIDTEFDLAANTGLRIAVGSVSGGHGSFYPFVDYKLNETYGSVIS